MVDVNMTEYAYQFSKPVPAGRVVLHAQNRGTGYHQLAIFEIPPDWPPLAERLRGTERSGVGIFGSVTVRAGEESRFAVELAAGTRYAFLCFLQAPDGQTNAAKGMNFEVRT